MADTKKTEPVKKERKPRGPSRTIEQQIEDLKAKAAATAERKARVANKKIAAVQEQIVKVESRLGTLYEELAKAQRAAGVDASDAEQQAASYSEEATV